MTPKATRALRAGTSFAVGSLPHRNPADAAALILDVHPDLPTAPELPILTEAEGITERWLGSDPPVITPTHHQGWLTFADAAASRPGVQAVKSQVAGPLTLAAALSARDVASDRAFTTASSIARAAADATTAFFSARLPHAEHVVFLDEPALVRWADGDGPIAREAAVDLLSASLAGIEAVTGVHVCGDSDLRMAIEAGPDIVGFPVGDHVLADAVAISRFLEGGGWLAWGAVPTDRPVGDRADHWWNALIALWCDLTRAGCDPVLLRTQSLITPACGLAGHSEQQAERILRHCVEIGERVREQAIATRLTVGA